MQTPPLSRVEGAALDAVFGALAVASLLLTLYALFFAPIPS